jgi:hypothetical protein
MGPRFRGDDAEYGLHFSENWLHRAKPVFLLFDNSPAPLTFINHIETIP